MTQIELRQETWNEFWPEGRVMAEADWQEHKQFLDPHWHADPDEGVLKSLADQGILLLFSARANGRLRAFISWTLHHDLESRGLLVAQQGSWFATRGDKYGLGIRIYWHSIGVLRQKGVQMLYEHHPTYGRGVRLRAFFLAQGARPINVQYMHWIGGTSPPPEEIS